MPVYSVRGKVSTFGTKKKAHDMEIKSPVDWYKFERHHGRHCDNNHKINDELNTIISIGEDKKVEATMTVLEKMFTNNREHRGVKIYRKHK